MTSSLNPPSVPFFTAPPTRPEEAREPLFRAGGLTKTYGEGEAAVHALRGVDLELYEGEMLVLLGPSGSGKSTLLNHLGGLDLPTSGSLEFRGLDLAGAGEADLTAFRRHSIGFVFQFYNLIPSLTARENVALITDLAPNPMTPEEALDLVELGDRMDHFPSQLSGGQQQRVAIARAFAKRPKVILCDEPTGALDARTGATVLSALERVNRELGTLTLIVTHNATIAGLADRVLHFSDGRLARVETNARRRPVEELVW